ncbi:MAG: DUF349 domain-containing protein [Thiotrichaceae bacterium]
MLAKLFKPKWQHKDPAVRIKALKNLEGSSAELITLAKSDPSIEVRLQTIPYLLHAPTLKALAEESTDGFAKAVTQRVTDLVLKQSDITGLETVYTLISDRQVHTKVAGDSSHLAAIRSQAITKIDDQELLFAIANTDNSKQIQYLAASQLTDYAQLKKLRKFIKTNKSLRNLLKDKGREFQQQENLVSQLAGLCNDIDDLTKEGRDQAQFLTIQQSWQDLSQKSSATTPPQESRRFETASTAFESAHLAYKKEDAQQQPLRDKATVIIKAQDDLLYAIRNSPTDFTQQDFEREKQSIQSNWSAITPQLSDKDQALFALKYDENFASIETSLTSLDADFQVAKQLQNLCKKADRLLLGKPPIRQKTITDLQQQWRQVKPPIAIDTNELHTTFTDTISQLKTRLDQQATQVTDQTKKVNLLLDKMEKSIAADQFNEAISDYQSATRLLDTIRNSRGMDKNNLAKMNQRISAATPSIKNAQSWRHWGTDNAREQLLERAQALVADTKIKPLERADQVKALRNEWKQCSKMDPSKHQPLWVEFDTACSKAYEPCQQFFKQESAQRGDNLEGRLTLCEQLETLEKQTDWKAANWRDVTKQINQLRGQWRKAGNVDRSSWNTANSRFNDAMDALEVHLGKERRHNFLQRQHLVTQAEALPATLEKAEDKESALQLAIQTAKSLQSQWKPTVTGRRTDEQKLWEQFRKAIDEVFNRQRSERDAAGEVLNSNLQQKKDLCLSLEALAKLEGDELLACQHQLTDIEDNFNQIQDLPRGAKRAVEQQFSQSQKLLHEKIQQESARQQISQLLLLGEKAALCDQHCSGKDLDSEWAALASLQDVKLEKLIQQSFDNTSITEKEQQKNTEQSQRLMLEIEILLDLETPEDHKHARMQYQVERLSEQMLTASDTHQSNEKQALRKIQDWYLVGAVADDQQAAVHKRFESIEAWLKTKVV